MNSNSMSRMPMLAGVGLALAAFLLLLPAPVHAATLNVTDDAFVKGTNTTNFGGKKDLKVTDSKNKIGFAKFDTSVLGPPDATTAASIDKATLRIFISKVQQAGDIDIDTVDSNWSEGTITGANQPTTTPIAALQDIPIVAADKKTFLLVNVDVTPVVKGWVEFPATNFGIAILPDGARIKIDSKENKDASHPMEIEVTHLAPGTEVGDLPGPNHPHGEVTQIIGGGTRSLLLNTSAIRFIPMFYGDLRVVESDVQQAMPVRGIVSDFFVFLDGNPGASTDSYVFTVRREPTPQGSGILDTVVTCTIFGTGVSLPFSCLDDDPGECFAAGDLISIEADPDQTPTARTMRWTALFTTDEDCIVFVP